MDRPDSPWRVLDDATAGNPLAASPGVSMPAAGGEGVTGSAGVSLRLAAGLIAAAILAVGAFGIAATATNGGSVTVDSGAAGFSSPATGLNGSSRPAAGSGAPVGGDLVVDVQGAVLRPGVHHLALGSRVADAVAAAGGYGPRVDTDRAGRELNLAALLHDGDRVLVPSRDDPSASRGGGTGGSSGGSGARSGGSGGGPGGALVDLNRATASELDALPGVGPVTAQKIIAAREEQPFATIEALRDRKVIGSAAFDKLKDLVTVSP